MKKDARILIACEESGAVTGEFIRLGFTDVWSCDTEPTSGNHPERHLRQDVTPLLAEHWDMIIAFPPCTYLSNAGAKHLYRGGTLNEIRYNMGLKAKEFFMTIYKADCPKIAIENPIASKIFDLPKHTQIIQPYMFGHPTKKKTCLWLKGLPALEPSDIVAPETNCRIAGNWYNKGGKERQKNRSKTFPGIARAMAEQWGAL